MAAITLETSRASSVPVHVAFSATSSTFITAYQDGFVEVYEWDLPHTAKGKAKEDIRPPRLAWSAHLAVDGGLVRQCACLESGHSAVVALLVSAAAGDLLVISTKEGKPTCINLEEPMMALVEARDCFLLQSSGGIVFRINMDDRVLCPLDQSFPQFCPWFRHVALSVNVAEIVGLSSSGRLFLGPRLLASDATSFTCTPDYLVYTTFSHDSKYVLWDSLAAGSPEKMHVESMRKRVEDVEMSTQRRSLERGARIVTVVPSTMSLVLQMPRGNLETISPRPLVLQHVRQDLDSKSYRSAFLTCRRQRIDLNILHDHDPSAFFNNLSDFVAQIKEVDHLNLFLTGLKDEDVTLTMYPSPLEKQAQTVVSAQKVNAVCDALRAEVEQRDSIAFFNTILTSYVRKRPPDYESALEALVRLKGQNAVAAEEAIKYIIFLSDANRLFDLALGMYDFSLVLMIAQHSQKDPREYLPFLRDLRKLDTSMQRFKIDDHLGRFDSALRNLAQSGPEHFNEALAYAKEHKLFSVALEAFSHDSSKYKVVLAAYAQYYYDERRWSDAALLFLLSNQPSQAIDAYKKAHAWREVFDLLLTEKRPGAEIRAAALEIGENLRAHRRFLEAGRVLLEYGRDVDGAIAALIEGACFAEAIRLTSLYNRRDLLDTHIKPGALETQARLVEDIADVEEQLDKQVNRLAELKKRKTSNPHVFYCWSGPPDSGLENVDLQPDGASDAGTAFTRYTSVPTTVVTTHVSGTTSRSRRKGGLKKAAGKKGTIYEESYILRSLRKTAEEKLRQLQDDTAELLPVLLRLNTSSHRSAAAALQVDLGALEGHVTKAVAETWAEKEQERREQPSEQRFGANTEDDDLKWVDKPVIASRKWRIALLGTS